MPKSTLQKKNQERTLQVKEHTHALLENAERLQVIAELIPDYIYSACISSTGKMTFNWISGAFEPITGYRQDEINDLAGGWSGIVFPEDRASLWPDLNRLEIHEPMTQKYRILAKSGEVRWIQDHYKYVAPGEAGDMVYIWGAVQNITERVAAEQTLHQYASRLEATATLSAALRKVETNQAVLDILVNQSGLVFQADLACIFQQHRGELVFSAGSGLKSSPPATLPQEENNLLYQSMRAGRVLRMSSLHPQEAGCSFCEFLRLEGIQALVVTPLRTARAAIGVLCLGFQKPVQFSAHDEQLLEAFAEVGGNTLHRFQVMTELERSAADRARELNVVYEVMAIASRTLNLDELLQKSLSATLQAVNCTIGAIHLIEPFNQHFRLAVQEQFPDEMQYFLQLSSLSEQLWVEVNQRQAIVEVRNLPTHSFPENPLPGPGFIQYLGAPIRAKGLMLGVLSIFGWDDSLFDPGVIQLVSTISYQLGLAVESARLRKTAEESMIHQERQRLAHNLHDSVSQSLYALVISSDVGNKLLRLKDYRGLRRMLVDTGKVALQALREMRLMLFDLRPASLDAEGLAGALEMRLNTVERRAEIDTSLQVEGEIHLSPLVEQEIYHITIEALNNVLRHSNATAVSVVLAGASGSFHLEISDNGSGFDLSEVDDSGGIGLNSMRERAHSLGGTFTIQTTPAQGTCIRVEIPLQQAERNGES